MWRLTRHAQLFSSKDKRVFFCLNFRTMKWLSRERSLAPSLLQCERNELSCNWTLSLITDSAVANGTWQALANILPQQKEETNEAQQLSNAKYLLFFNSWLSNSKMQLSYIQTLYFSTIFPFYWPANLLDIFILDFAQAKTPHFAMLTAGCDGLTSILFPRHMWIQLIPAVFLLEGKKNY